MKMSKMHPLSKMHPPRVLGSIPAEKDIWLILISSGDEDALKGHIVITCKPFSKYILFPTHHTPSRNSNTPRL